jgi:hypothetical protein
MASFFRVCDFDISPMIKQDLDNFRVSRSCHIDHSGFAVDVLAIDVGALY